MFWLTPDLPCFDPQPSEQGPPLFNVPTTTESSDQFAVNTSMEISSSLLGKLLSLLPYWRFLTVSPEILQICFCHGSTKAKLLHPSFASSLKKNRKLWLPPHNPSVGFGPAMSLKLAPHNQQDRAEMQFPKKCFSWKSSSSTRVERAVSQRKQDSQGQFLPLPEGIQSHILHDRVLCCNHWPL